MPCDNENDGLLILRMVSTMKKKHCILQKIRPHLIAECAEMTEVEVHISF